MTPKQKTPTSRKQHALKKEVKFYHQHNHYFKGCILAESQDFYTIELNQDVAGLNGIWKKGTVVQWSKKLTSVVLR